MSTEIDVTFDSSSTNYFTSASSSSTAGTSSVVNPLDPPVPRYTKVFQATSIPLPDGSTMDINITLYNSEASPTPDIADYFGTYQLTIQKLT